MAQFDPITGDEIPYRDAPPTFDEDNHPANNPVTPYEEPIGEEGELDARAAALLQKEFEEQRSRYLPITGEISNWITNPDAFNKDIDQARDSGLAAGTSAIGGARRDINRYGIEQTKSQKQQMQTGLAMDRTAGGVGAANNARENLQKARLAGAEQMIGYGNDLASQGIGGMTQASNAASNRAAQHQIMQDQADQATTANNVQVGTAAASVLAYAWIAGFI